MSLFTKLSKRTHPITLNSLVHRLRCMSNIPENTVYGGPKPQNPNQRVTLNHLKQKHKKGEPITVVTAYDYPSAVHLDTAGIDICLVGDSAAMVVHGHDTTLPISLDEMLVHCRAVARGAKRPLLVGDLPFGTYESSAMQAVDTAIRVLKEGGMDAIKLEGGSSSRISAAKSIVEGGIAVMGHVGLTPQAISVLGGFRPQGKDISSAIKVVETALQLQEAGCFSVVLECVPPAVAAAATAALRIPTIGIGAGPFCSGQMEICYSFRISRAFGTSTAVQAHYPNLKPPLCNVFDPTSSWRYQCLDAIHRSILLLSAVEGSKLHMSSFFNYLLLVVCVGGLPIVFNLFKDQVLLLKLYSFLSQQKLQIPEDQKFRTV